MRHKSFFVIIIFMLLFCCKAEKKSENKDAVYQYSTINALLEGIFDGDITLLNLKKYGDFGVGTFNALDGEMIMLDGVLYAARADGKIYHMDENGKTPFAVVKFFNNDKLIHKSGKTNLNDFTEYIDQNIQSKNIFYAFRVNGFFKYVKTRSVPPQNKPYPKLSEVTKNQPVFEHKDINGTIIGFRMPEYAKGINVAGYHFHFIDAEKKTGGHLLAFDSDDLAIEIDSSGSLILLLPQTDDFYKKDISGEKDAEVKKVEK